jgi:hypothetical protein
MGRAAVTALRPLKILRADMLEQASPVRAAPPSAVMPSAQSDPPRESMGGKDARGARGEAKETKEYGSLGLVLSLGRLDV